MTTWGFGETSARLKLDRAFGNLQSVDGKDNDGRAEGLHGRTHALFGGLITEDMVGRADSTRRVDVSLTASAEQARAPAVPCMAPRRGSSRTPQSIEAPGQEEEGDAAERQMPCGAEPYRRQMREVLGG